MAEIVHEIRMHLWRSPNSGMTFWVAKCTSCYYVSARYVSKANAEKAGMDHAKAKS